MSYLSYSPAIALVLGGENRIVTEHEDGRRWRWATLASALEATGLRCDVDNGELARIAGHEQDGREQAVLASEQLSRHEVTPADSAAKGLRFVRLVSP